MTFVASFIWCLGSKFKGVSSSQGLGRGSSDERRQAQFSESALSFLSLVVWFLPRKTPKFTKDFLCLPNPQNPWKRQRKHPFKQGNSLLKIYQGNPNKQGKEGQGGGSPNGPRPLHCIALPVEFLSKPSFTEYLALIQ